MNSSTFVELKSIASVVLGKYVQLFSHDMKKKKKDLERKFIVLEDSKTSQKKKKRIQLWIIAAVVIYYVNHPGIKTKYFIR